MTNTERPVRRLAGTLVLIGLVLGLLVNPWFFVIVGFVGLNLFQSSFTNFCPAEMFFEKRQKPRKTTQPAGS